MHLQNAQSGSDDWRVRNDEDTLSVLYSYKSVLASREVPF